MATRQGSRTIPGPIGTCALLAVLATTPGCGLMAALFAPPDDGGWVGDRGAANDAAAAIDAGASDRTSGDRGAADQGGDRDAATTDAWQCLDETVPVSPRQLFRSVGPGSTAPLAAGASNLEIDSSGRASFSTALPVNSGVGDVVAYDSDDSGTLDSLAVVARRTSERTAFVTGPDGNGATPTASPTPAWRLCRAYTSLANAVNTTANTCFDATLSSFDRGVRNLTLNDTVMNLALYADAADTARVDIGAWNTDAARPLRIFTPVTPCEVGRSQRHRGVWSDAAYRLDVDMGALSGSCAICNRISHSVIEGLQVRMSGAITNPNSFLDAISLDPPSSVAPSAFWVSYNLVAVSFPADRQHIMGIAAESSGDYDIWNNVVYAIGAAGSDWIGVWLSEFTTASHVVYHNTVAGWRYGFRIGIDAQYAIGNNVAVGNGTDYEPTGVPDSNRFFANISGDSSSPNAAYRAQTVLFVGPHDYHLAANDTAARDRGRDLRTDTLLPVADDIDGESRPHGSAADIGADEAP